MQEHRFKPARIEEAPRNSADSGDPLTEALAVNLRSKTLLLVLDNCEHLRPTQESLAREPETGFDSLWTRS